MRPMCNIACLPWENPSLSLAAQMWNQVQTRVHKVIFVKSTQTPPGSVFQQRTTEIKWLWRKMKIRRGQTQDVRTFCERWKWRQKANQVSKAQKTMVQDKIIVLIYTLIPPKCQWGNQTISNPLQCHATENERLSAKLNSTFKPITENINASKVYLGESWRSCTGEIYVLQSQITKSPWSKLPVHWMLLGASRLSSFISHC